MLVEMHCHSAEHSSCSRIPAVELVRQVRAKNLQGLVLTDHHYLWSAAELDQLRRAAEVPAEFLILSGQETNVPLYGDLLVYGAPAAIPRGTPLGEIRSRYPEAAIVWAHPYRDGREPALEQLRSELLDGIEIFNSNHTVRGNSRALQAWRELGFTATAGTDTHASGYAGIYPTQFQIPVASLEDLVAALKGGACRPLLKEIPHREAQKVTEVKIGTEAAGSPRDSIIIRTPNDQGAWSKAERAFHIMSAVAQRGFDRGSFRVPHPVDKDPDTHTLIEQGVPGENLHDKLIGSAAAEGREYLRLAALWLARLHGLRLQVTSAEEFLREESRRLGGELARFTKSNHPYRGKVADITQAVQQAEERLLTGSGTPLVQGHGDFQPRNIIVGQDDPRDPATLYLAAIDFERSQFMPPAFDVGWFLAQFRSQFAGHPEVRARYPEEEFLDLYGSAAGELLPPDFANQVELFRARANISIAAFLVKLDLGEDAEIWRILVESEQALTGLA
jgi:3',5'-nucleoside bisphosphate phosphatase